MSLEFKEVPIRSNGPRLSTLDGIRGCAAISVMAFHYKGLLVNNVALPSAYLAVDLFFVLSGLILCKIYEQPLRAGRGAIWFLERRIFRLYPVYLVSTVLAASGFLLAMFRGSRAPFDSYIGFFITLFMHTFILPSPSTDGGSFLFPINTPSWSVSLELVANIMFAVLIIRARKNMLAVTIAGLLALVFAGAFYNGLGAGASWRELPGGIARVTFEFFVGALLGQTRLNHYWMPNWLSWAIPMVVTATFVPELSGNARIAYDLLAAITIYPVIVFIASNVEGSGLQRKIFMFFGAISYPLYLLHMPVVYICAGIWVRVFHVSVEQSRPYSGLAFALISLSCATIVAFYIDAPVQRWIHKRPSARQVLG